MNIKELAEQAGIQYSEPLNVWMSFEQHLKRFAELVAAAEREACAKVCEEMYEEDTNAWGCAEAIRARGDKHD